MFLDSLDFVSDIVKASSIIFENSYRNLRHRNVQGNI